jgi:hypothetical protein
MSSRGLAAAAPMAHVEVALGHVDAPQDVFFRRHELDGRQRRLVVPREVGVGFGHARHQELAAAVDHLVGAARHLVREMRYFNDPAAFYEDFAFEYVVATAIENRDIGDCNLLHFYVSSGPQAWLF